MLFEWPAYSVLRFNDKVAADSQVHSENAEAVNMLSMWENLTVDNAQQRIDEANAAYEKELTERNYKKMIEDTIQKIENGQLTYREVFSDVYVCGDSQVAGLSYFGLINGNHLIARVNANLSDLENRLLKLKLAKPNILILHYGINSIAPEKGKNRNFVKKYRELIKEIKKSCPKTRIIVSLLFPVDTSVAREERFAEVDYLNDLLREMCAEEDVEYLDNSSLAEQCKIHTKGDGIHMTREFYTKYWGKHIIREMGIYK